MYWMCICIERYFLGEYDYRMSFQMIRLIMLCCILDMSAFQSDGRVPAPVLFHNGRENRDAGLLQRGSCNSRGGQAQRKSSQVAQLLCALSERSASTDFYASRYI